MPSGGRRTRKRRAARARARRRLERLNARRVEAGLNVVRTLTEYEKSK